MIHSFIHLLIHPSIPSLIHPSIHSLIHLFIHSHNRHLRNNFLKKGMFLFTELATDDASPFDLAESCHYVDHDDSKAFDTLDRSLESSPSTSPRPLSSPPPMPRLLPYGATTPTLPIDMTLHPLEHFSTGKMNIHNIVCQPRFRWVLKI
jgi:hypothetical protein